MAVKADKFQRQDGWVATFADLAALLLTFFVLTFSMSVVDTADLTGGLSDSAIPAMPEPDQLIDQVQLTAPTKPAENSAGNYLLTLLAKDLQRPSASIGFELIARGHAVELVFQRALEHSDDVQFLMKEFASTLYLIQQRINVSVSIVIEGIDAQRAANWMLAVNSEKPLLGAIDRIDARLTTQQSLPRLKIILEP